MESLNTNISKEEENVQLTKTKSLNEIWSFHEDLANRRAVHDKHDDIPTDLKHYLNQPTIDLMEDPLYHW